MREGIRKGHLDGRRAKDSERTLRRRFVAKFHQISCSSEAVRVTQKWGVTFEDVMPLEAVEKSALGKVQNFYRFGLRRQFRQPRVQSPRQSGPGMSL